MPIVFECEYRGERFVGFDKPTTGRPLSLYQVREGQLIAAVLDADRPADVLSAITATATAVTVRAEDPDLRFLPPLLPAGSGDAMLSGFMRTHESKWLDDDAKDDPAKPYAQWFFKGLGSWLRMPGEPLVVPQSTVALIEEPEVVLVYVNDDSGTPRYAGYTFGNDLCDIGLHQQNPGYNAYCKLCDSSIAPWLFLGEPPQSVSGQVTIERDKATAWAGQFQCGADSLHFPVEGMMRHLLSYPALRRPGLVNYVLLGADRASFHDGFRIAHGDRITIEVTTHDVVLSNAVQWDGQLLSG